MGPTALGAHDNSLIACTISPAIGLACSALHLRVKSLDFGPAFLLRIPHSHLHWASRQLMSSHNVRPGTLPKPHRRPRADPSLIQPILQHTLGQVPVKRELRLCRLAPCTSPRIAGRQDRSSTCAQVTERKGLARVPGCKVLVDCCVIW